MDGVWVVSCGGTPAPRRSQVGRRRPQPGADAEDEGVAAARRDAGIGACAVPPCAPAWGGRAGARRVCGSWAAAALVLACVGSMLGPGCAQNQAHRASIPAVQDLSDKFADVIRQAACDTLRTGGVGCRQPGMQDKLQKLQAESKAYRGVKTRLDTTVLEKEILPQINGVFLNASRMLFTLRDNMEDKMIRGHRIETLETRDMSKLPEWDATHPRWKDATETVVNGKIFDKPVIKESSLKYPPYVSPGERRVMLAANASDGLNEYFAENLLNPHNAYLRWQRFVSNTGMTRQFPGSFDDGEYDNRLAPWYKMATQTPKRVIFLLDLSGNMLFDGKIEIAKTTIITLLNSLIPEDYVTIIYMDDFDTVPKCFGNTLVPASPANINELIRFVKSATVGAAEKLIEVFDRAESMLKETDQLVTRAEKLRAPEYLQMEELTEEENLVGQTACRQHRCSPMNEYIMLVSDGVFKLGESILQQLDKIVERRPLLHTISIAVGPDKSVGKGVMSNIACRMKGLYFHIKPIDEDHPWSLNTGKELVAHESYVLEAMNEYFQMIAAPLSRNHSLLNGKQYDPTQSMSNLSLDVTWSLPTMDSKGEAVVITIALPCFGDSDKHTPRLLGVVAIDMLFLLPGENFGRSLISYFYDVEKDEPVDSLMDLALVFKSGYVGWSLIDNNLLSYYEKGVDDIKNFEPPENYHYLQYLGDGFAGDQGKQLMTRILSDPSGLESFTLQKDLPLNAQQWMLEPLRSERIDMTCAWLHVPGHPFVLVLVAKGKPDDDGLNAFMRFEPSVSTPSACPPRNASSSQASINDMICWEPSPRHLMAFDPSAPWGSWLYVSKIAYQSTPAYLQQDALVLPPKCSAASALDCKGAERIQKLMTALNNLEQPRQPDMAGQGLTTNAFKDILLTSLVESLWAQSLTPSSQIVQRVFISTVRGVYRTLSRPLPPCTGGEGQCQTLQVPIDLPFLYTPQSQPWYNRAQGVQGRIVLSPFLTYGGTNKSFIVISQAVRHGYVEDANTDFGIANTAAVMGAELDYTALHSRLYGEEKLAGTANLSSAICGSNDDPNTLYCFVVDQAGVLLFHPDASRRSWESPVFFGNHEPALMEFLVQHNVFKQVERASVQVSSKRQSDVLGYAINEEVLPIHLQLSGEVRGYAFLSNIPDTNAFLLAVEHYESSQKAQGCGMLSTQCPNAHFPVISPRDSQRCGVDEEETVYLVSGAQPLTPHFDSDAIMEALQMMMNCPVVFPAWIPWAILIGVVSMFLVLVFMIIKYIGYVKRRNEFIRRHHSKSDERNDASGQRIVAHQPSRLEKKLLHVANKISKAFVTAQAMDLHAQTFDDYRTIIQTQAELLDGINSRKDVARSVNHEKLSALAKLVCTLRLLTTNLDRRLKVEETEGAASCTQALLTELAINEKQYTDLKERLEALMLPTVNIDKNIDAILDRGENTDEEDEEDAAKDKEAQDVQAEEDFYSQYYPHLIKFESGQSELDADQSSRVYDATEMSAITERSINERAVEKARLELRKSMTGTAIQSMHADRAARLLATGHEAAANVSSNGRKVL